MCALTADRQTTAMPNALIATDLDLALDVLCNLAAKISFDPQVVLNVFANPADLIICQIADPGILVDL